jgi:predicted metal-dependent phosphoesterase TrpH
VYKVDLHTHSHASPDGGITPDQYRRALSGKVLDCIAITDHNRIDAAQAIQKELGDRIIVGEEIMTTHGEIIGLYLKEAIPSGLSPLETALQIHSQSGIVMIPHPFETTRKGLSESQMSLILDQIDLIEICNGRALNQKLGTKAVVWSKFNNKVGTANSDAHGAKGLGGTYNVLRDLPTQQTLVKLLSMGSAMYRRPSPRELLYPKYHRIRKKLMRSR